jgi:hypothetical protein
VARLAPHEVVRVAFEHNVNRVCRSEGIDERRGVVERIGHVGR